MGSGATTTPHSATPRLGAESGDIHRRTRRLTIVATITAHLIGAVVVVVLLLFVLPVPREFEGWTAASAAVVRRNLIAAMVYIR